MQLGFIRTHRLYIFVLLIFFLGGCVVITSLLQTVRGPEVRLIQKLFGAEDTARRSFDVSVWKAQYSQGISANVRLQMLDDLLHQHDQLIGLSQADVVDLIGVPHSFVAHGELFSLTPLNQPADLLNYRIGQLWSSEVLQLSIRFEHGPVIKAYVDEI